MGGRADARQLASSEGNFELALNLVCDVAGEERVDLVEEKDHAAHRLADFVSDRERSFGERAAHVRAGDELRDGQLDDDSVVERRNVLAGGDPLRNPVDHRRLSDTRGTHQDGVVRVALGEDVERLIDVDLPPYHRIEGSFRRCERQVATHRRERRKKFGVEGEATVGRRDARAFLLDGDGNEGRARGYERWRRNRSGCRRRLRARAQRNFDGHRARRGLRRPLHRESSLGFLILRRVASRTDSTEGELHRGAAKARDIDPALGQGPVRSAFSVVDEGEQKMQRARAAGAGARRELASTLHCASERIGFLVRRRSCGFEENVGTELSLEKKLGSLTRLRDDGSQEMATGRPLLAAMRQLLGQPSKDQQIRLGMGGSHRGGRRRGFSRGCRLGQVRRAPGVDSPGGELETRRRGAEK